MKDVKLGQRVKDWVSGFEGIATCKIEYLNGCVRVGVQGKSEKGSKIPDIEYVDIQQLKLVDEGILGIGLDFPSERGGDRPNPTFFATPKPDLISKDDPNYISERQKRIMQ